MGEGAGENPLTRFSVTVDDYRKHRPDYPRALFDWIAKETGVAPGSRVLDLGAGTGIVSRMLAARGWSVVGLEPNRDMLAAARAAGGGPRYVQGRAETLGFARASFPLATAGQAFHWFDHGRTVAELDRVLTPGGSCAVFWNMRTSEGVTGDYERALIEYSEEFAQNRTMGGAREVLADVLEGREVREAAFPHHQLLDLEGLLGRARSASYVAHGMSDRTGFERELAAIFERHAQDGVVRFGYRCEVLLLRAHAIAHPTTHPTEPHRITDDR